MSAIKIEISPLSAGLGIPRTHVFVDGKFAYQSMNHPEIEKEHIERLISLIVIENIEVIVK